jgi:capsular exopolysaccharide synthesis family protein
VELGEFLNVLWRRKFLIILVVLIAVSLAFVANQVIQPVYTANALIRVSSAPNPLSGRSADINYFDRLMNTYVIIVGTNQLLAEVRDRLGLNISSARLHDMVQVKSIDQTELIEITVNHPDAKTAADIANAVALSLIQKSSDLTESSSASAAILTQVTQAQEELNTLRADYDKLVTEQPNEVAKITEMGRDIAIKQQNYETLQVQYNEARLSESVQLNSVSLIETATAPNLPTIPRKSLNVALGALLGLAGGLGLALFLNNFDTRVYSLSQVKNLIDLPVLAELTHLSRSQSRFPDMQGLEREGFQRLRSNIIAIQKKNEAKTLIVTSAENDEGKSTVVCNLGMAMSQLGRSVLIVDCDMRRPNQHTLFGLTNEVGLSTVLNKKISLQEAVQKTNLPSLKVLTSGPIPEDPTRLLSTAYTADVIREMGNRYDVVILDTPAMLPVVDATLVAPTMDAVLMVIRRGRSHRDSLTAAHTQLTEVQANVVGVVLNDALVRHQIAAVKISV